MKQKKKSCKLPVMAQKDVQSKLSNKQTVGQLNPLPGFHPDPFLGAMVLQDAEDKVWEDLNCTNTYKVTEKIY